MLTRRFAWMVASLLILSAVVSGHFDGLAVAKTSSLTISALKLSKSSVVSGESLTAQASITNARGRADASYVSFWIAPAGSTASPSRLARTPLGRMLPNSTVTVVSTLSIPSATPSGTYQIITNIETPSGTAITTADREVATLTVYQLSLASPSTASTTTLTPDLSSDDDPVTDDSASASPSTVPVASEPTSSSSTTATTSPSPSGSLTTSTASDLASPTVSTLCDYYASPAGSGNGRAPSSPFRIQDFWSVATPGTILCLLNGVYQGAANMIDPPDNKTGTAAAPITIRAMNEGAVLIDGQFQRTPIHFSFNHYFTVEGVNVRNGGPNLFAVNNNSSHITGRRIVAWDTNGTKEAFAFGAINGADFTTFEDVAAFGVFCRGFHHHGSSSNTVTIRRAWVDWQGYMGAGDCDTTAYHLNYGGSPHMTCENCLGSYSMHQQPFSHTFAAIFDDPAGSISGYREASKGGAHIVRIRGGAGTTVNVDTFLAGSLFYVRPTDRWRFNGVQVGPSVAINVPGANRTPINNVLIRDVYVLISPSNPAFNFAKAFHFPVVSETSNADDLKLINTSSVAGLSNTFSTDDWQVTNMRQGQTVGSVPNPWTTTVGANLCKRRVNRGLTTTPLWPWPMNDRIKAATAAAGRYTGPCGINPGDCRWGDTGELSQAPLRTAIDVTTEVEALLGTIPQSCRTR